MQNIPTITAHVVVSGYTKDGQSITHLEEEAKEPTYTLNQIREFEREVKELNRQARNLRAIIKSGYEEHGIY
tara:strand:+ start:317 stop:532 length:216 start_codon:yes stop_codon:yes gene_type:complete